MRNLKLIGYASLVLSLLFVSAYAADSPSTATVDKSPTLNVELHGKTVNDAIKALFAGTDIKYIVLQSDGGAKIVDLTMKGVTLNTALKVITSEAGLRYVIDDGVYVITSARDESASTPNQTGPSVSAASSRPAELPAVEPPPAEVPPQEEVAQYPVEQPAPDYYWQQERPPFGGYPPYWRQSDTYQVGSVTFMRGFPTVTFNGTGGVSTYNPYGPYRSYGAYGSYGSYNASPHWAAYGY